MIALKQGFTLIELLIVTAIIGILAAVLIPQLYNARVNANKRAVQAHSATVYKVAHAIKADELFFSPTAIATQLQANCASNTTSLVISGKTFLYGWTHPATLSACTVTVSGDDFIVVVQGNFSAGGLSSTNGQNPL